ncbi:11244_t:CDS:10, partial [Diversispora eburnea]
MDDNNKFGVLMIDEKTRILVVKNIKCTLNHNVINQRFGFFSQKQEIYLTVQYGDDEGSTKSARLRKGQDKKKKAYYTESITLPITKVSEEFKVTCYDGKDVGNILGVTKDTLKDALNRRGAQDDVGKGRKVQLELSRGGEIVGEVTLYLMFLGVEAPRQQMRQIELESLRGTIIGVMIIDNIRIKNLNGHRGHLRVMLGDEKASTEKYFRTTDNTECPYAIVLPEEDLWLKLMNGGQVSVPEISFYTGSSLAATANLKISMHKFLNPLQLLPHTEEVLIDLHELSEANVMHLGSLTQKDKLEYLHHENDDYDRINISPVSPSNTTPESLEQQSIPSDEDLDPSITQPVMQPMQQPMQQRMQQRIPPIEIIPIQSRQTSTSTMDGRCDSPSIYSNSTSPSSLSKSIRSTKSKKLDNSLRIICQRYVIVSPVSAGPHKTFNKNASRNRVYLAKHLFTDCDYICKEHFHPSSFSNEIKHLRNLKSDYIVKWADLERCEDGGGIIVLENYGESLDNIYHRFRKLHNIVELFYNICGAVQFLYNHGVVHTDLCPSNIICEQRTNTNIKLCDLEHVKFKDDVINGSTSQQQALTIGFAPPEFFNPNQEILYAEHNQDIFSVGAIFYFLYTKKLLYKDTEDLNSLCREFETKIKEEIPQEDISNIIIKSCRVNPEDRWGISELWLPQSQYCAGSIVDLSALLADTRSWQASAQSNRTEYSSETQTLWIEFIPIYTSLMKILTLNSPTLLLEHFRASSSFTSRQRFPEVMRLSLYVAPLPVDLSALPEIPDLDVFTILFQVLYR